jgi:cell division protein FtsW (lipid II flippase)
MTKLPRGLFGVREQSVESTGSRRTFFLHALTSLAAVLAGAAILASFGLPSSAWMRNVAAWLVGAVLAFTLLLTGRHRVVSSVVTGAAVAGLAATFLGPPQEGVHRCVDLGPLHISMAALLLPAALVALAFEDVPDRARLAVAAVLAALLILQPDASQATSFLLGASILFLRRAETAKARLTIVAAALAAAVAAWIRPDALQPVPEVELVFSIGWTLAPVLAAVAALALAATCFVPLSIRPSAGEEARDAALALAAYMAAAALCPLFGAFPVPLVGIGMSFVVGYWLAIGLLCAKTSQLNIGAG